MAEDLSEPTPRPNIVSTRLGLKNIFSDFVQARIAKLGCITISIRP